MQRTIDDAKKQDKDGLVTVAGKKKFHFMSDAKWLIKQGFEITETTTDGFSLLAYKIKPNAAAPKFNSSILSTEKAGSKGITVYYSNRCPFTEYHINISLTETTQKKENFLCKLLNSTLLKKHNRHQHRRLSSVYFTMENLLPPT